MLVFWKKKLNNEKNDISFGKFKRGKIIKRNLWKFEKFKKKRIIFLKTNGLLKFFEEFKKESWENVYILNKKSVEKLWNIIEIYKMKKTLSVLDI